MRQAVLDDMHRSMNYIHRYKSDLLSAMKAIDLIPCEGSDEEIAQFLDVSCGIDYIRVSKRGQLAQGVGCRFQADVPYRTITIRKERESGAMTELEKRKLAIEHGGIYPYYTMHAYVDTKKDWIDRLAIAKTEEIVEYCLQGKASVQHTCWDKDGQAFFYVVDWEKYKNDDDGHVIYIWDNPNKEDEQTEMDLFANGSIRW